MLRYMPFVILSAAPLHAEVPRVVTDIPPVHALVSQVMGDLGAPELVVRPGASPHHHTMRPSEARMLSNADAVVWVGPGLTRWLEEPIENLATDASVLTLMNTQGVLLLPFREGAAFEAHDHDHGGHEDHEGNAAHEDEEEHAHDDHEEHADDDHAAEQMDPHVWLSPQNGSYFLNEISALLGELDPENAATYAFNAKAGEMAIAFAAQEISAELSALDDPSFIVLHDAYHYFEAHFDVEASGSISAADAQTPGAQRMQSLRAALVDSGVRCAFSEPEIGTKLLDTATEGLTISYGVLDPLGADHPLGADLYVATLRDMARGMARCLGS